MKKINEIDFAIPAEEMKELFKDYQKSLLFVEAYIDTYYPN